MPISGHGWELLVKRLGIQQSGANQRTYGTYQVFRNGLAIPTLSGHICERIGPGDNQNAGNGLRIEQGRYPLWTQFGRYRSIGYSTNTAVAGDPPMPAIRLEATGNRTGILIHPAHPPKLYLSSIGCFNPSSPLTSGQKINFWDSRQRVIDLLGDLRTFSPLAFQHETATRIAGAAVIVDGEPMNVLADEPAPLLAAVAPAAVTEAASLPISKSAAIACAQWLMANFGDEMRAAVNGKAYMVKHLCAIVCQETAYKWLKWTAHSSVQTIVERCVFDASGDYPGTSRTAFPVNTAAFRARYGDTFTNMLIEEANLTRRLQGWGDKDWVYKGYGIFQFDLQNVTTDRDFFENKGWYSFSSCLDHCCSELDAKLVQTHGDLWQAIKRYNGSGASAEQYMRNVRTFTEYCATVTGD